MVLSLRAMLDFHGGLPSSIREQTGTVTEYYLEFMAHADRVHMNDHEILLACFINGLEIQIHREVFFENPKSLFRALCLAIFYEKNFADQIQQIEDPNSSGVSEKYATAVVSFKPVQPQQPVEDAKVIDKLQINQARFDADEIGDPKQQQMFSNHNLNPDLCPPIGSAMKAMGGEDTATQSPSSKPSEQSTAEIQVEVMTTILPGMAESVARMKFLAREADANAAVVKRALKAVFIDAIVFTVDHELPVVIKTEAAPVHCTRMAKTDSTHKSLVFDPGGMKSEILKALATITPISKLNFDIEPCIQMGIIPINIKGKFGIFTSTQTTVETNFLNDESMGFFPTATRVKFQKWLMNWFDSSYVLIMIQSVSQLFDDICEICSAHYFCEGVYFEFTVADWNTIVAPCYYCTYPFAPCDTLIVLGSFYGERGKLVNNIVYFTHQLFEQWLMTEFCTARGLGITKKDSFWHELRINESLPCVFNVIVAKGYLTHDYSTIGWFTKTKYAFGVLPFQSLLGKQIIYSFGPTVEEFIIETNVSSATMFVTVRVTLLAFMSSFQYMPNVVVYTRIVTKRQREVHIKETLHQLLIGVVSFAGEPVIASGLASLGDIRFISVVFNKSKIHGNQPKGLVANMLGCNRQEFLLIVHAILYHSYWFVWTTKEATLEKEKMLKDLLYGCLNSGISYFSGYSGMASSGIKLHHSFIVLCCLIEYKVNMGELFVGIMTVLVDLGILSLLLATIKRAKKVPYQPGCSKSLQLIVTGYATGVLCAIVFHHGGHSFYFCSKLNSDQGPFALFEIPKFIWVCYNWLEMSSSPHPASKLSNHIILTSDLEDKVNFKGEGNVTCKMGPKPKC